MQGKKLICAIQTIINRLDTDHILMAEKQNLSADFLMVIFNLDDETREGCSDSKYHNIVQKECVIY